VEPPLQSESEVSTGAHKRRKGVTGEREVTKMFEDAGAVRLYSLEKGGDTLVELNHFLFHVETKRQERLDLMRWVRQAESEAGASFVPVVCFRQSKEPWRVTLLLKDFLDVVDG
jgi:hypothetical protein